MGVPSQPFARGLFGPVAPTRRSASATPRLFEGFELHVMPKGRPSFWTCCELFSETRQPLEITIEVVSSQDLGPQHMERVRDVKAGYLGITAIALPWLRAEFERATGSRFGETDRRLDAFFLTRVFFAVNGDLELAYRSRRDHSLTLLVTMRNDEVVCVQTDREGNSAPARPNPLPARSAAFRSDYESEAALNQMLTNYSMNRAISQLLGE